MNYETEEDDEVNSVLWVGNLDSKVTEAMVYELFLQAGPVKNVHFPKGQDGANHKGYCFVQFYQNASVPYTMEVMEGATMFGRKLKLQPRPGSIHRKIMDQKIAQKRQEILLHQQQPHLIPHQQAQNPVLFGLGPPPPQTTPQLAQIQNMVIYQNQMFQPYSPAQNANHYPVAAFQPQVGPQIVQIQMQQQQAQAQQQQQQQQNQQPPTSQQQSPRHFQQQQLGYSFISSPTHRIHSSHVAPLNNTSNYPRHPQIQQHQHQPRANNPGGMRSQRPMAAITNGHIVNGNRLPFQPRHGHPNAGTPLQQQPPPVQLHQQQQHVQLVSPIYHHHHHQQALLSPDQTFAAAAAAAAAANGQTGTPNNHGGVPLTGVMPLSLPIAPHEMQFYGRPPGPPQQQQQPPLVASPATAAGALGIGNGYQNIIYHY